MTTVDGGVGLMALPEGGRVDFGRMRFERRRRVLDAMDRFGLDALVLGRPANVTYASGARQLWTAGARPFGPACIVVAETERVHLLSVWDEGVPAEISHEDLFGLSWNPAILAASIAALPGLDRCRQIGTDSLSPGFPHLIAGISPDASIVDAGPALWSARATKSDDELTAVITATAIAEAALSALREAVEPGVTERALVGVYTSTIARLGAPTPPTEGVVCAAGDGRLRQLASGRPIGAGELVVLNPGAMFGGYEGGVGRTVVAGGSPSAAQVDLASACRAGVEAVVAACRVGSTGSDLRRAWEGSGPSLPTVPLVHGLGLGMEPPIVAGDGVGDAAVLEAGMVLAVQGWVDGVLERDVVTVTADGPRVLTRARPGLG